MNEFELFDKLFRKVSDYRILTKRFLKNRQAEYRIALGDMRVDIDRLANKLLNCVVVEHIQFINATIKMRSAEMEYFKNIGNTTFLIQMKKYQSDIDKMIIKLNSEKEVIS